MAALNSKRRVALITGATGQDGAYSPNTSSASAIPCTASSAGRPRSIPLASTIFITIATRATCRS